MASLSTNPTRDVMLKIPICANMETHLLQIWIGDSERRNPVEFESWDLRYRHSIFYVPAMQIHDIYRETYNSRNVFCCFRKHPPGAGGGVCRRFTPAVKGGRLQWQDLRGLYRQDQISRGRGKAMVVLVLLHMKLQESSW